MQNNSKLKRLIFFSTKGKDAKKATLIKYSQISFLINVVNISLVFALQKNLPPEVPLFFGLAKGEEQLTTKIGLIIPGVASLFTTLLNLFLSFLTDKDFLQKMLIFTALATSIISFITVIKIILLVGSF